MRQLRLAHFLFLENKICTTKQMFFNTLFLQIKKSLIKQKLYGKIKLLN